MSLQYSAKHLSKIVQNSKKLKVYQFKVFLKSDVDESKGLKEKYGKIKKECIDGKLIEEAIFTINWKCFFGRALFRDKVLPNIIINLFGGKNGT